MSKLNALDLIYKTQWAITEDALNNIITIAKRDNPDVEALEAKLGKKLDNTRKVRVRNKVAVIPITGPIFRHANLFTEISGATSLEILARDFTAALEDPEIDTLVLNIDSPGGQAAGIAEFATLIRAANKPVHAYVEDMAASAAYWIASAADQIHVGKTATLGSIGVVAAYPAKKDSDRIEIVSSQSPKKRPDITTDEGKNDVQTVIDQLAQIFIEDIAQARQVTAEKVQAEFGQGGMLVGANAVATGMADHVTTLEQLLTTLTTHATQSGVTTMTINKAQQEKPAVTLDTLKTEHPAVFEAAKQEGYDAGLKAGKQAELERIKSVEAQTLPGHETLIQKLKFDGETSGDKAAVAVLQAEKEKMASINQRILAESPKPVNHTESDTLEDTSDLSREDKAKRHWNKDKSLQEEFGEFETYLAFTKAQAGGLIKIKSAS